MGKKIKTYFQQKDILQIFIKEKTDSLTLKKTQQNNQKTQQ